MSFALGKGGTPRVEITGADTPHGWAMTYYFEDGTALRVTHPSMDAYAAAKYDIGEREP